VPTKAKSVQGIDLHPAVFQFYVGVGVCLSSLLMLIREGTGANYTWYGFASAFIWVPGNFCAMSAVKHLGIATAQSSWASLIVTISFIWAVTCFGQVPGNWPLTIVGLVMLMAGIAILAKASAPDDDADDDDDHDDDAAAAGVGGTDRGYAALKEDSDGAVDRSGAGGFVPNRRLGWMFCAGVGCMAGSVMVPLELAPPHYRDGLNALDFAYSQVRRREGGRGGGGRQAV
jgi:hypothetical protein